MPLLDGGALDIDGIDAAFAAGARGDGALQPAQPDRAASRRASELEALAAVADAHGAWVIADEIHAPLTFPGETFVPWLTVAPRGVALTSASKAFNLTALKLGLIVGEPVERLSDDLRDHAGYLGVLAAEAAFRDGDEWLDETLATIAANHAALPSLLPEEIVAVPAQASFLAWLDCRAAGLGDDPAAAFLERGRVAVNRGLDFGAPGAGYARLNVGTTPGAARGGRHAPGGGADAVKVGERLVDHVERLRARPPAPRVARPAPGSRGARARASRRRR